MCGLRKECRATGSEVGPQRDGDLSRSVGIIGHGPDRASEASGMLTPEEKAFLDVFLHEATTSPFRGPATDALHKIGVEYHDISYLAWAYHQEVGMTDFGWGHAADVAPPLPWADRDAALRRD